MKVAVILPVFNHAKTVRAVALGVRERMAGLDVTELIVIDDGCTDGSAETLADVPGLTILRHEKNRGKGHALMTGFRHAHQQGFTHAATLDADGQHDLNDLANVITAARASPQDLIIGERNMDDPACPVPRSSKKGRDVSRFWMRVHTGQKIADTQCGLRVYPLESVLAVRHWFRRYDFETEILARMAWGGLRIRSVPIRCIYFRGVQRVTHFRPVVDTLRGVRVNAFLLFRHLMPIPFKRLAPREQPAYIFGKWWKAASWRDAFAAMIRTGSSNSELAAAFALGIFVGLTPFYGLQTILAIYFARRLHLNVLAVVVGSQISIPPLVPLWLMLSYGLGNLLLHGRWIGTNLSAIGREMVPAFLLGNLLVALGVALVGLITTRLVLHFFRGERAVA